MPADRRITVSFTQTTFNRAGEAETTTTTRELWATRTTQDGVARSLDGRGSYGASARAYRIRYWPDLVRAIEAGQTVTVTDEGTAQTVQSAGEPEGTRRRFLDLLIREAS